MDNYIRRNDGYVTILLTLIMAVLLSLCLTMVEGARRGGIRLESEIVAETAINSCLAEYHRMLLERYNLFAIDSSYGSDEAVPGNTEAHMMDYLQKNLDLEDLFLSEYLYRDFLALKPESAKLEGIRFLTDGEGTVLRRRCAEAVKNDLFLQDLQMLQEYAAIVESQNLESADIYGQFLQVEQEIERRREKYTIVDKEEIPIPYESPFGSFLAELSGNILRFAVREDISEKMLSGEALYTDRLAAGAVNVGNLELPEVSLPEGFSERLFFQGYIDRYFVCLTDTPEDTVLDYELEYLVCGKPSDQRNLLGVAERLFALRSAIDYICIQSDATRVGIAQTAAVILSALILSPELEEAFKQLILLGWSMVEAAGDVRTLCGGGRVPFWKTPSDWGSSLESAMGGEVSEAKEIPGLSYKDHMQIFLFLMGTEKLTGRVADLMEATLRGTPGNEHFRLDGCMDEIEATIVTQSAYGYRCELTRQRGYR